MLQPRSQRVKKPSRPTSASKRAPKQQTVITVAVDSALLYLDAYAPPEAHTEAQTGPTPELKAQSKITPKRDSS